MGRNDMKNCIRDMKSVKAEGRKRARDLENCGVNKVNR